MDSSCEHLKKYKATKGFTSYKVLHAYYVVCIAKGSSKKKTQEVECSSCHRLASRMHACLHCVYFGCFLRRHIHEHASKENHSLGMDILSGSIFCFECKDYVYDEEFRTISMQQKQEGKRKGTVPYIPWTPSKKEIELLIKHDFKRIRDDSSIGLRGLFNMGNTCYMNCIIQVLVHTPLLRDYFLSDKHVCSKEKDTCRACMMSDIFQEFYSGWSAPLPLDALICITRKDFAKFSGGDMHDAEEFFSSFLETLHSCCQNEDEKSDSDKNQCSCVIHQVYSGYTQSNIHCLQCKKSSPTVTPFWHVSLAFEEINTNGVTGTTASELYLKDFLERHTGAEILPSQCGNCSSTKRTIQVTFKKLPVVICFYFKRLVAIHSKIATPVFFPEYLDMTPYLTPPEPATPEMMEEVYESDFDSSKNVYTLFAVVCHSGNERGHYFSYVRHFKNSWYCCNDTDISKVEIDTVLNSEGYLLFYHKSVLEYEFRKPKSNSETKPINCNLEA